MKRRRYKPQPTTFPSEFHLTPPPVREPTGIPGASVAEAYVTATQMMSSNPHREVYREVRVLEEDEGGHEILNVGFDLKQARVFRNSWSTSWWSPPNGTSRYWRRRWERVRMMHKKRERKGT